MIFRKIQQHILSNLGYHLPPIKNLFIKLQDFFAKTPYNRREIIAMETVMSYNLKVLLLNCRRIKK